LKPVTEAIEAAAAAFSRAGIKASITIDPDSAASLMSETWPHIPASKSVGNGAGRFAGLDVEWRGHDEKIAKPSAKVLPFRGNQNDGSAA
jgi:hypothetical protein